MRRSTAGGDRRPNGRREGDNNLGPLSSSSDDQERVGEEEREREQEEREELEDGTGPLGDQELVGEEEREGAGGWSWSIGPGW